MRALRTVALAIALLGGATSARADDVYWSTKSLLSDFFKSSERVTFVRLDASAASDELRALLGYAPAKKSYPVFIARTGEHIDGYAVIDEEMGQHQPITFGVKILPSGEVERMEVMVYREGYGDEIKEARFKKQFTGKNANDGLALGDDVVAISGATISSKAMTVGVRRALALVSLIKARALDQVHSSAASEDATAAR